MLVFGGEWDFNSYLGVCQVQHGGSRRHIAEASLRKLLQF